MAKALYGHLTAPDPRLAAEIARLRLRVAELEAENAALRDAASVHSLDDDALSHALGLDTPVLA